MRKKRSRAASRPRFFAIQSCHSYPKIGGCCGMSRRFAEIAYLLTSQFITADAPQPSLFD